MPSGGWPSSSVAWGSSHAQSRSAVTHHPPLAARPDARAAPGRCRCAGAGHGRAVRRADRERHPGGGAAAIIAPQGSRLSLPIRVASSLHVTTNPIVIRRWVLLPVGKPCDERRRAESERILRTQPYIAQASVRAVADTGGTVFILVETTDEYTPVLATGGSSASPLLRSAARGGRQHCRRRDLCGGGVAARRPPRLVWRARAHYQLFGRPYLFDASAYRGDEGKSSYSILATHPLYTDLQRVAWLLTTSDLNYLYGFARPDSGAVLLGQERQFTNVGAVVRIGQPGQLSLFGLSFSQEEVLPRIPPVRDTLPDSPRYAELFERYPRHRSARVNALWAVATSGSAACRTSTRSAARRTSAPVSSSARSSAAAFACSVRPTTTFWWPVSCMPARATSATSSASKRAAKDATSSTPTAGMALWGAVG